MYIIVFFIICKFTKSTAHGKIKRLIMWVSSFCFVSCVAVVPVCAAYLLSRYMPDIISSEPKRKQMVTCSSSMSHAAAMVVSGLK